MKTLHVAAAMILHGDRILATQRGDGTMKGQWEFPGGKQEPGEKPEETVVREIREELDACIHVKRKYFTLEYDYPEFHLSMDCFLCTLPDPDRMKLLEHQSARWLTREELDDVPWLPADRELIDYLKEHWF